MHEFSTAQAILGTVIEVATRYNASEILEVDLEIGEFTLLNPEQLNFAFKVLSEGTIAKNAKLKIFKKPGKIKCNTCGYEGNVEDLSDASHYNIFSMSFRCPKCGSTDTDILGGRETNIKNIKIKRDKT
ncbi:MAG: hydrogenase maturation nickel metallochaperone HypA [Candidatus Odinarchaeia archaeon]